MLKLLGGRYVVICNVCILLCCSAFALSCSLWIM